MSGIVFQAAEVTIWLWVRDEYQSFKLAYCCTLLECYPEAVAVLEELSWDEFFFFGDSISALLE